MKTQISSFPSCHVKVKFDYYFCYSFGQRSVHQEGCKQGCEKSKNSGVGRVKEAMKEDFWLQRSSGKPSDGSGKGLRAVAGCLRSF